MREKVSTIMAYLQTVHTLIMLTYSSTGNAILVRIRAMLVDDLYCHCSFVRKPYTVYNTNVATLNPVVKGRLLSKIDNTPNAM